MFNSYTEEFKKNAVAVVKTGYGVANLAKRLHVPPSSIRNWLDHPKYMDVEPADEKLLAMIPAEQTESHGHQHQRLSDISVHECQHHQGRR